MRVSRWMFAGLAILAPVGILGPVGCGSQPQSKTPGFRLVKCEKEIKVDPQFKHGVDLEAVYVCEDEKVVTWKAATGVNFSLDFHGNCPFDSCQIDQDHAKANVAIPSSSSQQPLTVYKYSITINGNSPPAYDPQIIGGGGH